MADFKMEVVRKAIRTDTGLETFTISGFGTPKAAIFIATLTTANSTTTADVAIGWGVTDGTNNRAIAVAGDDGVTTSNTDRGISNTKCLFAVQGGGTLAYEGDFDSFGTDNVVIDITTNNTGIAAFVTCILIGGTDVAEVGVGTYVNSTGGNTFTGLGFSAAPSLVFLGNIGSSATSSIAVNGLLNLGVVDFGGNQAGSNFGINTGAGEERANQETFAAGATASSQGQSLSEATQWETFLDTPLAAGWDVNINTGNPNGDVTTYLALRLTNSPALQVFTDTLPTSSGPFDYSAASFTPGFLYGVATENTSFDTHQLVGGVSFITADASTQICNSMSVEDDLAVMVNNTISGATLFDTLNKGITESYVGTLTGFTSDGYDANFSIAEPTTNGLLMWGLLIEETSAAETAALTGTMTATVDEDDITAGGKTTITTTTGDTWVAAGATFNAQRQNIIDGFDAASSPTNGWNNEVRDKAAVTECVRTSDTVVTITWAAQAGYDISAQEVITQTIPASALVTSTSAIISTPTFTVDQVAAGVSGSHSLLGVGF